MATPPGFEPRPSESKSDALPIKLWGNNYTYVISTKYSSA